MITKQQIVSRHIKQGTSTYFRCSLCDSVCVCLCMNACMRWGWGTQNTQRVAHLSAPLQKTKICPSSSLTMTDILFLLLVKSNKLRSLYSLNLQKYVNKSRHLRKDRRICPSSKRDYQLMVSPFYRLFKGRIPLTNINA